MITDYGAQLAQSNRYFKPFLISALSIHHFSHHHEHPAH